MRARIVSIKDEISPSWNISKLTQLAKLISRAHIEYIVLDLFVIKQ